MGQFVVSGWSPDVQPGEVTYVTVEDREAAVAAADSAELAKIAAETSVTDAEAARDAAIEAAEAAAASADIALAPTDVQVASLVVDDESDTAVAMDGKFTKLPGAVRNGLTGWFHADGMGVVGDGVANDTAAIQAAVDDAAGNGILYFPPATYKITSTVIVPSDAHVVFADGSLVDVAAAPAFKVTGDRVSFRGGLFQSTNRTSVAFSYDDGVDTLTLSDFECVECRVVARTGGNYAAMSDPALWASNVTVARISARATPGGPDTGTAIRAQYARKVTISDCVIEGYYHAIAWWGGDANPANDGAAANERRVQDLVIANCIIRDIDFGGIWGSMGQGVTITGCVVTDCGDVGIDAEGCNDVTISGNRVADCTNGGITTFFLSKNVSIVGNTVSVAGGISCVKVYNSNSGSYLDNTAILISGNTLRGQSTTVPATVIIESSADVEVTGNLLTNVRIGTQTTGNFQNVSVRANKLVYRSAMSAAFSAVYLRGALVGNGHSAVGNDIMSAVAQPTGSIGIQVAHSDGNATPLCPITDNRVRGFETDIHLTSAGTNTANRVRFLVARNILQTTPIVTVVQSGVFNGEVVMDDNLTQALLPHPSAVPTSGRWQQGQVVRSAAPAAAGTIGWVNTVTGWAVSTAWAASTVYAVGDYRTNDSGKVYVVTTGGTSAGSGGPTGTSTSITDNTVTWRYVGVQAVFKTFGTIAA